MKKIMMMALTLCLVFSLAQVTVADDRLKINGNIRLRAYDVNDEDYDADAEDHQKYIDHRFRLGMAISVAEGITANLRADFADDVRWGYDTGIFGRPLAGGSTLEIDRMFIRIERDMFNLQVGQILQAFGAPRYASAYAPQNNGIGLRLKLPVVIDLNYFKFDEGTSVNDDLEDDAKDVDQYGVQFQYRLDKSSVGAYYVTQTDGKETKDEPNVIGLWGNTKLGPVSVRASLDMFGGSSDAADVDYIGTQLWLNGEMGVTKATTVGANVYYALAQSDDGSERQITVMPGKFGGFSVMEKAIGVWFDGFNPAGASNPFDVESLGAGSMGADVYGLFTLMDGVIVLGAQVGFIGPSDSDVAEDPALGEWSGNTFIEGSLKWTFAPKCDITFAAYTRSASYDEDTDSAVGLGAWAEFRF